MVIPHWSRHLNLEYDHVAHRQHAAVYVIVFLYFALTRNGFAGGFLNIAHARSLGMTVVLVDTIVWSDYPA